VDRTKRLKEALGEVMSGLKPRGTRVQQRLYEAWRAVIGEEQAGHTRIKMLKRGQLHIEVDSAPLLHHLTARNKAELVKGVQEKVGGVYVSEIRLKLAKE
jgi:predicted nucleic acid-binding Zn ribbon protein